MKRNRRARLLATPEGRAKIKADRHARMARLRADPTRLAIFKTSQRRNAKKFLKTEAGRKYRNRIESKRRKNPAKKMMYIIRSLASNCIRRSVLPKSMRSQDYLGCTPGQFKAYLESQFISNMSWANYGRAWHVDHIIPLASFNLSSESEIKKACHYTNLRPLWAKANIRKSDKITVKEFQPMLLLG